MSVTTASKKKLIEVALPLAEINDASAYDKMPGIGPHPKGIHHWWARLPLPTARAVLFASVVDDPSSHLDKWPTEEKQDAERDRLFGILRRMMGKKLHEHPEIYAEAWKEMLKHCQGEVPVAFDPFAGGGSIPLEASRMGFEAHAGDLNPVAVLLNKCNLELAPRWAGRPPVNPEDRKRIGGTEAWRSTHGLAADVRYYARLIGDRARAKIGYLYPKVRLPKEYGDTDATVIAWIWTRTVSSPNPIARGRHVPLASSFVLSTRSDKVASIEPSLDDSAPEGWKPLVRVGVLSPEKAAKAKLGAKAGKAQAFICALTGAPIPRSYVQSEGKEGRLGKRMLAIVADGPRGKLYLSPEADHETVGNCSDALTEEARTTFLAGALPTRAEITGGVCTAYGLSTWGHLFHSRQLIALVTLSDLVQGVSADVHRDMLSANGTPEEAEAYSRTVTTFLALALDRCADFNNVLCRWSPSNQKVMNLFARQALPMVFDFAEANILGEAVGAWKTCSEHVADCVEVISAGAASKGTAHQNDAASGVDGLQSLLVSTDPPYYDNISYGTLSDFFYVWLRRAVGGCHPELFGTLLVPKQAELIASPDRFGGSRDAAKAHFESGFRKAFAALREKMDPRFPLTVYYAFKQNDEEGGADEVVQGVPGVDLTTGWETLLEALIGSGFQITATWPVRASQKWRMVSMGTNALASYIVLACRSCPEGAPMATRKEFLGALKKELHPALHTLQQANIAPVDLAQAAIGPGMAVFSRYAKVMEPDGSPMSVRRALALINQELDSCLAEQEGEMDADSRFCLAWFEQYGMKEGPYGVAETLSKAKNTSVEGIVRSGCLSSKAGKVRILSREEMPSEYDPATDDRRTVWECAQHMVKQLASGGIEAAGRLTARMGPDYSERTKALAYRLFVICERKKWADEALAYNSLITSWGDVQEKAQTKGTGQYRQPTLDQDEP